MNIVNIFAKIGNSRFLKQNYFKLEIYKAKDKSFAGPLDPKEIRKYLRKLVYKVVTSKKGKLY